MFISKICRCSMLCLAIAGAIGAAGCAREEKILDIETPSTNIEVTRPVKPNVDVDVD